MQAFSLLNWKGNTEKTILLFGAHSDDIEIGCGGTILNLTESFPNYRYVWVVLCANGVRASEAYKSANLYLENAAHKDIVVMEFRDGFFPYEGTRIKEYYEQLRRNVEPDLIFTHYRHDLHQDHRVVSDLTWNTFRDHLIFEYEIPKYDGDLGSPNLFVPLSEHVCREKIRFLLESFASQADRPWFTREVFEALMRLRGMESGSSQKYAESFFCRKLVWSPKIEI